MGRRQGKYHFWALANYPVSCRLWHINSLGPSMHIYESINLPSMIGSNNGWSAPSNYLNQWWNIAELTLGNKLHRVKFQSKFEVFHSRKCVWKCRLRNGGLFVQGRWVNPSSPRKGLTGYNSITSSTENGEPWIVLTCLINSLRPSDAYMRQ